MATQDSPGDGAGAVTTGSKISSGWPWQRRSPPILPGLLLVAQAAVVDLDVLLADLTRDPPLLGDRLHGQPDAFAGHHPPGYNRFLLMQHHLPAIAAAALVARWARLVDQRLL